MADDAVAAYLNVVSNLQRVDDTLLVDIDAITDRHLQVAMAALVLLVSGPDDALLANDRMQADLDLSKVATHNCARLNNRFSVDVDLV